MIDLTSLKAAGLVHAQARRVKVILKGELSRAVTVKGVIPTKGARAAIEAAGGTVEACFQAQDSHATGREPERLSKYGSSTSKR